MAASNAAPPRLVALLGTTNRYTKMATNKTGNTTAKPTARKTTARKTTASKGATKPTAKPSTTNSTTAPTVQLYTLNPHAQVLAQQGATNQAATTLQRSAPGHGMAWRATGKRAPNTRAHALATVAAGANGKPFSALQAQGWLQAAVKAGTLHLGSGTPASYVKAFIKNTYFTPAK